MATPKKRKGLIEEMEEERQQERKESLDKLNQLAEKYPKLKEKLSNMKNDGICSRKHFPALPPGRTPYGAAPPGSGPINIAYRKQAKAYRASGGPPAGIPAKVVARTADNLPPFRSVLASLKR